MIYEKFPELDIMALLYRILCQHILARHVANTEYVFVSFTIAAYPVDQGRFLIYNCAQ